MGGRDDNDPQPTADTSGVPGRFSGLQWRVRARLGERRQSEERQKDTVMPGVDFGRRLGVIGR